jgi:hypothetical protein
MKLPQLTLIGEKLSQLGKARDRHALERGKEFRICKAVNNPFKDESQMQHTR